MRTMYIEPGMVSDADLTTALLIAVALIIVALIVWPGIMRIRPHMMAGYWASQKTGIMYEIRLDHGRRFIVLTNNFPGVGAVHGLRGVRINFPGVGRTHRGHVDFGNRQIIWRGGDVWSLQGIR